MSELKPVAFLEPTEFGDEWRGMCCLPGELPSDVEAAWDPLYTADQLRAYGEAVREACISVSCAGCASDMHAIDLSQIGVNGDADHLASVGK